MARQARIDAAGALQHLSISESEAAHRLNIGRSAISRAVQRARHGAELMATAKTILALLKPEISQQ